MTKDTKTRIPELLMRYEEELKSEWLREQLASTETRRDLLSDAELRHQSTQFLGLLREAVSGGLEVDLQSPQWAAMRGMLTDVSRSRARQGFSPAETATFVLSFKRPLVTRLAEVIGRDSEAFFGEIWNATALLDKLALFTTEIHQKTREEVISRQQAELLELSTPVVQLWEGILALPIIGTLDSRRTQTAMESLLQRIVETGSEMAIIDITGVPTVDTLTAQHLLKTITATRLMGAECILSGIRPQIAQTIVHLGVDLGGVLTKASMATALELALARRGLAVSKKLSATRGA